MCWRSVECFSVKAVVVYIGRPQRGRWTRVNCQVLIHWQGGYTKWGCKTFVDLFAGRRSPNDDTFAYVSGEDSCGSFIESAALVGARGAVHTETLTLSRSEACTHVVSCRYKWKHFTATDLGFH
jgi:hypothetical protein